MKTRHGEKINFKYNFSEYWSFLKKHKLLFFSLLFIALAMEIIFAIDKFLFKIIIDKGEFFLSGDISRQNYINVLVIIGVIYFAISLFRGIGSWIKPHLIAVLEANLIKNLKQKYFNHILSLSHSFHTTHKTGSLISRLNRGASAIEIMTDVIVFNIAPMIFSLIVVGISLAYFNIISMIVIIIVTILFISHSYIIQNLQQSSKLELNSNEDSEKGLISDVFTNISSIKYFGKEKNIEKRFLKAVEKTRISLVKYWDYFRWFDFGHAIVLSIGLFALIYFPLIQFLNKEITLGTLVFIYTIYGNLMGPIFGFAHGLRGFYRAMADFQDLFEYGKIENEIKDKPNAKELEIKEGSVEFRNVNFSYGKRKLLQNFNLKIKPKEKVALVGHSGCGKTTLVNLLNRLYDVNSGEILIDGKDIREFKQESLRGETGIVPQECILFDETIYNNIKFANPKASRKEIENAIKFAQLDRIIKNFPKGENTIVGERGVKLSGGEKQRVSIARAILANKKILVLDEATSALDSETENEIQKSLYKLLENRTSIIIAHRLSTIMNADRIIVMKNGGIIQQGKHSELIKQQGEYHKLWNLQKHGYIK